MSTLMITLKSLTCNALTEPGDDEIYFELEAHYEGERRKDSYRAPAERGATWRFLEGQTMDGPVELYTDVVGNGVAVHLRLREQDFMGKLSQTHLGDDFVGEIVVTATADGTLSYKELHTVDLLDDTPDGHKCVRFNGCGAEYIGVFHIRLI